MLLLEVITKSANPPMFSSIIVIPNTISIRINDLKRQPYMNFGILFGIGTLKATIRREVHFKPKIDWHPFLQLPGAGDWFSHISLKLWGLPWTFCWLLLLHYVGSCKRFFDIRSICMQIMPSAMEVAPPEAISRGRDLSITYCTYSNNNKEIGDPKGRLI